MLVTPTAIFLPIIVDIEQDFSRLALLLKIFPLVSQYLFCSVSMSGQHMLWWILSSLVVLLCYREKNRLKFSKRFGRSAFYLHYQVSKMDEPICSVDSNTVVSHEVQQYHGPCQNLHYEKLFCKSMVSIIKFMCGCCHWFLLPAICFFGLKIERIFDLEEIGECLLFNSIHFTLSICTNINWTN